MFLLPLVLVMRHSYFIYPHLNFLTSVARDAEKDKLPNHMDDIPEIERLQLRDFYRAILDVKRGATTQELDASSKDMLMTILLEGTKQKCLGLRVPSRMSLRAARTRIKSRVIARRHRIDAGAGLETTMIMTVMTQEPKDPDQHLVKLYKRSLSMKKS